MSEQHTYLTYLYLRACQPLPLAFLHSHCIHECSCCQWAPSSRARCLTVKSHLKLQPQPMRPFRQYMHVWSCAGIIGRALVLTWQCTRGCMRQHPVPHNLAKVYLASAGPRTVPSVLSFDLMRLSHLVQHRALTDTCLRSSLQGNRQ